MEQTTTEREKHHILVDTSTLVVGENTIPCTICGQVLTLLWDGETFRLTPKDETDPTFGTIEIEYK